MSAGKTSSKARTLALVEGGFTLLELILVLVLIGLIAGLTIPFVMSSMERIKLQSEVRTIASALKYARSEAITRKTVFEFKSNLSNGEYWLSIPNTRQSTKVKILDPAFRMTLVTPEGETLDNETITIRFFPRGNSTGGTLHVEKKQPDKSDPRYLITIDPITGSPGIRREEG